MKDKSMLLLTAEQLPLLSCFVLITEVI